MHFWHFWGQRRDPFSDCFVARSAGFQLQKCLERCFSIYNLCSNRSSMFLLILGKEFVNLCGKDLTDYPECTGQCYWRGKFIGRKWLILPLLKRKRRYVTISVTTSTSFAPFHKINKKIHTKTKGKKKTQLARARDHF